MTPIFYREDRFSLLDSGWFWLSETPSKPSIGWDAKHRRITTWAQLYNTHTHTLKCSMSPSPSLPSSPSSSQSPSPSSRHDNALKKSFLVVNTHFDHIGAIARVHSAQQIRDWIEKRRDQDHPHPLPTVMAGDLNPSSPDDPCLHELGMKEKPLNERMLLETRVVSQVISPITIYHRHHQHHLSSPSPAPSPPPSPSPSICAGAACGTTGYICRTLER